MVRVILERSDAARTNTDHHVAAITCRVWSPSRIGPRTDPFSAVRRRPVLADRTSPAVPSRLYADDTQIYGFCQPSDVNALADRVSACFGAVSSWMRANRLQVNPSKTEVLWCASGLRQHQIPTSPVRTGSTYVPQVSSVRDIGVYIDSDVSLRAHVTATVRFAALRQIRIVRRCLPQHALLTLIRDLVVSKVDYYCSVLAGVSDHLLDRLQSILNAAARLVFSAKRSERITPLLRDLHWLRVPERNQFRLCILAFRCLNGSAPPYLAESIPMWKVVATSAVLQP